MKKLILIASLLLAGCSSYPKTEIDNSPCACVPLNIDLTPTLEQQKAILNNA